MKQPTLPGYWNRNYRLFFLGCLASRLGNTLSSFTTSLFFLDMTGSAALMSAYLAWTMGLSLVLTPLMGAVVDRLPKTRVMWICDFLFGATDLTAAALLFSGVTGPAAAAVVFVNGTINCLAGTLFTPAADSMMPLIVEKQQLSQAYSAFSTMGSFVNLFGAVCAAALYGALGYRWILLFNGLCVAISGIAEMFIRTQEKPAAFQPTHLLKDWVEGLRYLKGKRPLLALGGCALPMNFFANGFFAIALPFMINTVLKLPPMVLAGCEVGLSVGCILMALFLGTRKQVRSGKVIPASLLTMVFEGALIYADYRLYAAGLCPSTAFVAILIGLFVLMGASMTLINVPLQASMAALIDAGYMARVQSLFSTLCSAAVLLAAVVYGFLIDGISLNAAMITTVAGIALCYALVCSQRRHIRQL